MNYLVLTAETRAMGLLRRLGTDTKPDRPYECKQCETAFPVEYQVCPECGCYSVERDDWA